MLSRTKPAIGPGAGQQAKDTKKKKALPKVEDFLDARDYTGAITLLEVWNESSSYTKVIVNSICRTTFGVAELKQMCMKMELESKLKLTNKQSWVYFLSHTQISSQNNLRW